MGKTHGKQRSKQGKGIHKEHAGQNLLRALTMLAKAIGRLVRRSFQKRRHYPGLFFRIQEALKNLRAWIREYRLFAGLPAFQVVFSDQMKALVQLIAQLQKACHPSVDQEKRQKSGRYQTYLKLCRTIDKLVAHFGSAERLLAKQPTVMAYALEQSLRKAVEKHRQPPAPAAQFGKKTSVSQRGEQSYIFACAQSDGYLDLVADRKRFWHEVVAPWRNQPV